MPKLAKSEKRVRSASLDPAVLTTVTSFFDDLPAKPKESLSLREAVTELKEPLQAAMAKGYSYDDLAAVLGKAGIPLSPATLKNYVPVGTRSGRRGTGRRKSVAEPEVSVSAVSVEEPESTPVVKTPKTNAPTTKAPTAKAATTKLPPAKEPAKRGRKPKSEIAPTKPEAAEPKKPEIVSLQKGAGTRGRPKKAV